MTSIWLALSLMLFAVAIGIAIGILHKQDEERRHDTDDEFDSWW